MIQMPTTTTDIVTHWYEALKTGRSRQAPGSGRGMSSRVRTVFRSVRRTASTPISSNAANLLGLATSSSRSSM